MTQSEICQICNNALKVLREAYGDVLSFGDIIRFINSRYGIEEDQCKRWLAGLVFDGKITQQVLAEDCYIKILTN